MAINKVASSSAITSIIFLSVVVAGLYSAYIWSTDGEAHYLHSFLNSRFLYVPEVLMSVLEEPGILSVLAVTVTLSLHCLAYSLVFTIISFASTLKFYSAAKAKETTQSTGEDEITQPSVDNLTFHSNEARILLKAYRTDTKSNHGVALKTITNVFPETYMKLKRMTLTFNRAPVTPIEHLEAALLSILAAHRECPADPHGHHSDQPLYEHSRDVAARLRIATNNHPLATTIGLAHDIGKIAAYSKVVTTVEPPGGKYVPTGLLSLLVTALPGLEAKLLERVYRKNPALRPRKSERWEIKSKMHDKLSAHILRLMPEFRTLPESEQIALNTVVSYSHNYERTPKKHTTHVELDLLRKLREVDGLATADDQSRILDLAAQPEIIISVSDALRRMIPALNVNSVRSGFADGWTSRAQEYVAIQESVLRENLSSYLDSKIVSSLGLSMDKANHPATPAIRAALDQMGYLIKSYAGYEPKKGLFSIRSGRHTFHGIFLLKREALESTMGDTVTEWGDCPYPLKISHLHKGENDDQTQNHPEQTHHAKAQS
jgi:hypothetical protein